MQPRSPRPPSSSSSEGFGWARSVFRRPRPPAEAARPAALPPHLQMKDELRARFLVHDASSPLAVRNLYTVYKSIDGRGWAGVEALPPPVVGRALVEAEILQQEEPSTLMGQLVEELRVLDRAAQARAIAELQHLPSDEPDDDAEGPLEVTAVPEVTEVSEEEYALVERSWVGTVPNGLQRPDPEAPLPVEQLRLDFAPSGSPPEPSAAAA